MNSFFSFSFSFRFVHEYLNYIHLKDWPPWSDAEGNFQLDKNLFEWY